MPVRIEVQADQSPDRGYGSQRRQCFRGVAAVLRHLGNEERYVVCMSFENTTNPLSEDSANQNVGVENQGTTFHADLLGLSLVLAGSTSILRLSIFRLIPISRISLNGRVSDVVLCGHSYAGCVIAGVADQVPDRIRALVFLDAFVLEKGESLMDIVPSEAAQAVRDQAKATGDGWKVNPIPARILGVRDPRDVAWLDAQCTPQAILNASRISPICFRQNAIQIFW
jgi:hypothetical protein